VAIVHLCPQCGLDLARVRARREPHYGFMIVTCPGCLRVAVRRPHPLRRFWRGLRRLDWVLTLLALNVVAGGALVGLAVVAVVLFLFATAQFPLGDLWDEAGLWLLAWLALPPILVGAWMRTGLPHWRPRAARATFAAILLIAVGIAGLGQMAAGVVPALEARWRGGPPAPVNLTWVSEGTWTSVRGAALVVLLDVMVAVGTALGRGPAWLLARVASAMWRIRRRRLRRWRTA
jgi:hypothetical protein